MRFLAFFNTRCAPLTCRSSLSCQLYSLDRCLACLLFEYTRLFLHSQVLCSQFVTCGSSFYRTHASRHCIMLIRCGSSSYRTSAYSRTRCEQKNRTSLQSCCLPLPDRQNRSHYFGLQSHICRDLSNTPMQNLLMRLRSEHVSL